MTVPYWLSFRPRAPVWLGVVCYAARNVAYYLFGADPNTFFLFCVTAFASL